MFRTISLVTGIIFAALGIAQAEELLQGFNFNHHIINPACIYKMRPSFSNSENIIIKSIILEHCRKSNWAEDYIEPLEIIDNKVVTSINGKSFSYEVIGKIGPGLFIVRHSDGVITAYEIDSQTVRKDLQTSQTEKIHILTTVIDTFVPCFKEAKIKGKTLTIEKYIVDTNSPTGAEQCKKETEILKLDINL